MGLVEREKWISLKHFGEQKKQIDCHRWFETKSKKEVAMQAYLLDDQESKRSHDVTHYGVKQ